MKPTASGFQVMGPFILVEITDINAELVHIETCHHDKGSYLQLA